MIEATELQQAPARPGYLDRLVVLDDDPTGVQTLAGIRVLLAWDGPGAIARALERRRSVHLVTNTRALEPDDARAIVAGAARATLRELPSARLALRGDSTLRAHLVEEYLGLCDARGGQLLPLLLVPALPPAGRVTRDGVHLLERDGRSTPLHETEYAGDGPFAYSTARLLDWAEERSGGLFQARLGRELHLDELRARGPELVTAALGDLSRAGRPAVLAPDAASDEDLATIASGYATAVQNGAEVVVRCAPAFAGVLAGTTAPALVPVPRSAGPVLVVCGSYVPISTRQLAALDAAHPGRLVEIDAQALAGADAAAEEERAASAASAVIAASGLAILATGRHRPIGTTLAEGSRIAEGLARIAGRVGPAPPVVIAKGGITAAVTLLVGFGISEADVLGPVLPGVSRWGVVRDGVQLDYLVVPGNVGDERLLVELVDRVREG